MGGPKPQPPTKMRVVVDASGSKKAADKFAADVPKIVEKYTQSK